MARSGLPIQLVRRLASSRRRHGRTVSPSRSFAGLPPSYHLQNIPDRDLGRVLALDGPSRYKGPPRDIARLPRLPLSSFGPRQVFLVSVDPTPFHTSPLPSRWITTRTMLCCTTSSSRYVIVHVFAHVPRSRSRRTDPRRRLVQALRGERARRCLPSRRLRPLPCLPLRESLPRALRGRRPQPQPRRRRQDSQRGHPRCSRDGVSGPPRFTLPLTLRREAVMFGFSSHVALWGGRSVPCFECVSVLVARGQYCR